MSYDFNGSTQYASGSSTLLTNEPIDMFACAFSDSATADQQIVHLGNNGASGDFQMNLSGSAGGDPARAGKTNDAGTFAVASTSSGYSASTWHRVGASWISNTSRAAYINGGSKGTDTTSITDPTPDYVTVGAARKSAVSQYFDGKIHGAVVASANGSDTVHAGFGAGISPLSNIPLTSIRGWYPMLVDANNHVTTTGNYPNLTLTGSPSLSTTNDPLCGYPRIGSRLTLG